MSRACLLCWAAYLALMTGIVVGLFVVRGRFLTAMNTADAQADWQAWRIDAAEQDEPTGPVQRRIPKSDEPPTLVLLRDYFGIILAAAVVFPSVLFWFLAFLIHGLSGFGKPP